MKNILSALIKKDDEGKRLDEFLSRKFTDKSRSSFQKLIENGRVFIDGKNVTSKKYKVKSGQEIKVSIPEAKPVEILAEDISLDIVYEDEDVLVVNKPAGMVVHPAVGNYTGTLVNGIMYHCKDSLSGINGELRPGIVHRIDKDTSGLIVIAKNDFAHRSLAKQLKEHTVNRRYYAIVYNNFTEDFGRIEAPIGRDKRNRKKQGVDSENGKYAVTNWRVVERFGRFTFIECKLETGRTHQIRVHMASVKHPLLGDDTYGPDKNKYGVRGQMLHAHTLGFIHPKSLKYMEFTAELPTKFVKVLDRMRAEM